MATRKRLPGVGDFRSVNIGKAGPLQRQSHLKTCSPWLRVKRDFSVMGANDPVYGVQAYSCTVADAFGGEKWLKEMRLHSVGNAGPIVDNLNENEIELPGGSNDQLALAAHGIDGIVNEIRPDLVQLTSPRQYPGKVGVKLALHFHAAFQAEFHHGQGAFQTAVNVDFLLRRLVHVGVFFDRSD